MAGVFRHNCVSQGGTWSLMPTLRQEVCASQSGATQDASSSSVLSCCGHTTRAATASSSGSCSLLDPLC